MFDRKHENSEFTRRALIEVGTISGVAAVAAMTGGVPSAAAAEIAAPEAGAQNLGALLPGLTYIGLDALAFSPIIASQRVYQHATGVRGNVNDRVWAPLTLPVGSAILQISASYLGQPIIEISRRPLFSGETATAPVPVFQQAFPPSPGGPFASTVNLSSSVVISAGATYLASAILGGGASIIGAQIGYRPPTQSFVPYTGSQPRIFDTTRDGGPLVTNVARTIFMGQRGVLGCVFNLNAYGSPGGGFINAYPANIARTGAPSVQYHPRESSENLVISRVDPATGSIKLFAYGNPVHAFIDLIGYLV